MRCGATCSSSLRAAWTPASAAFVKRSSPTAPSPPFSRPFEALGTAWTRSPPGNRLPATVARASRAARRGVLRSCSTQEMPSADGTQCTASRSVRRPGSCVSLKVELESKLQSTRAVCLDRMKEGTSTEAARVAGGIVHPAVAVDGVIGLVALVRVVNDELGVVEDVETLGTEFKSTALRDLEVFQNRQIKVQTAGIIQEVASCVSEGKSGGSGEGVRIEEGGAKAFRVGGAVGRPYVGISDHVRIGSRAGPAGHARIVENRSAIGTGAIDHAERRSRLKSCDAGYLPPIEKGVSPGTGDFRQGKVGGLGGIVITNVGKPEAQLVDDVVKFVQVADVQQMTLVEVGTRLVRGQIEGIDQRGVGAVGGIVD